MNAVLGPAFFFASGGRGSLEPFGPIGYGTALRSEMATILRPLVRITMNTVFAVTAVTRKGIALSGPSGKISSRNGSHYEIRFR